MAHPPDSVDTPEPKSPSSLLIYGTFLVAGIGLLASLFVESRHPWKHPGQATAVDGAALFQQNCAICHGKGGDGRGPAANVLDPQPRNFQVGKYRLVTSGNGVAARQDVIRTIRHGMPGTSMPAWLQLSDEEVSALADYVLSVSRDSLKEQLRSKLYANSKLKPDALEKKLNKSVADRMLAEDPVHPGPEPTFSAADVPQTRALFNQVCAVCHGPEGKGMQNPEWRTEEGMPIASRNFRSGVFKGGGRGTDIYARIYSGIPGTPMPSFASISDQDIWRLAHFVQNLASPADEEPWVLKIPAATGTASTNATESAVSLKEGR